MTVLSPVSELAVSGGLRLRPRQPIRLLLGALLVVAAVTAALVAYTRSTERVEVLAVTRTVLAGERIGAGDVRVVSLATDDVLATVPATSRGVVVGQYARVRLATGALLVPEALQPSPLVTPGRVLMSVAVPVVQVPVGLREQSQVVLVVPVGRPGDGLAPVLVDAVVTGVPRGLAEMVGGTSSASPLVALSVEVPAEFVALVGSVSSVGIGVLDPSVPIVFAAVDVGDAAGSTTEAGGSAVADVPSGPAAAQVPPVVAVSVPSSPPDAEAVPESPTSVSGVGS